MPSISDGLSESPKSVDREPDSPVLVEQPIPHGVAEGRPARSVDWDLGPLMKWGVFSPTEGSRLLRDASGAAKAPEYETLDPAYGHPGVLMTPSLTIPKIPPLNSSHTLSPVPSSSVKSSEKEEGIGAMVTPSPPPEFYMSHRGSPAMPTIPPRMGNGGATTQVPERSHFSVLSDSPSRSSSRSEIVPPHSDRVNVRSSPHVSSHPSSFTPIAQGSRLQHTLHRPISGPFIPIPPIEVPDSPYSIDQCMVIPTPPRLPCGVDSDPYFFGRPRDNELWFEDGNIVLQTSNIEFRVYKGPLLALSPVLGAICEDTPTTWHGGSVGFTSLGLFDTSPEDLRHVLRFVYGATSRVEPSFGEISAHIRFGRKYTAEKLLQRSLDYLKKFYVTELDAWVKLPSLDPPLFEPIHAIGIVNLVRLLKKDGEALLPIALMRCCTLGSGIVEGFIHGDGTRERLSPDDLGRCFEGKVKLLEASVRAAETLRAHMTTEECNRPRRCKDVLGRFVGELLGSEDSASGNGGSPLVNELRCLRWDLSFSLSSRRAYLQEASGADVGADVERELCPKCFVRQVEEQRKIFAKLPKLMGVSVEGWATKGGSAAN